MTANTWGVLGHLTADQKPVLDKLRQHVKEHKFPAGFENDKLLLRFCRARKFKLKLVIEMLDNNRKFVEEFQARPLSIEQYPGLNEFFQAGIMRIAGFDKCKRPIVYFKPSLWFPAQLGFCQDDEALKHFFAFYFTCLARAADESGGETFNIVLDLKGWGVPNNSVAFAKHSISTVQNHFPERLGVVHVVFAPLLFRVAWRILCGMMEPRTRKKFHFIKDPSRMLEYIEKDVLEKTYGGEHDYYPAQDMHYHRLVGGKDSNTVENKSS